MEEYTTKFYQLLEHNDILENDDQLLSRHIGGMHGQFQDVLNMLDSISVSEAHQRALQYEKQLMRRSSYRGFGYGSTTDASSSYGFLQHDTIPPKPSNSIPKLGGAPQLNRGVRRGLKCFSCFE